MYLEVIIAIIIFNYLRKSLRASGFVVQKDRQLIVGMAISVSFLVLGSVFHQIQSVISWLAHALLFWVVYIILNWQEFRKAKSLVYAILPIVILSVVSDLTKLINSDFHTEWKNYFEIAKMFAFVWMIAMWIVTNRQQKALEKEQLKALEKEKEHKITEALKAELEIQVTERTAALVQQKTELELAISELKSTQAQLIQSEKMASLGELTAGIAHEIQNPLNFVNNFSEVNEELLAEMKGELDKGNIEEAKLLANDALENQQKILHHGKRADAIVKGMLQHSRSSSGGVKEPTDINALTDEYLRLAYHGLRAKDKSFNATMKTDLDSSVGNINIIPQDIGRVILNLITNAFYVVNEKKKSGIQNYEPTVTVTTKKLSNKILVSVKDNGTGIPENIKEKIFQPFFTTKPTGQGTGLGLSLSYDIVKAHGGELKVETKKGEGSEFFIELPVV
jgi:two-component system, NtrC family, sensor kinase